MKSTRAVARLGMMAVGLGIGGAIASSSGIAAAESSFDWLSAVDSVLGGGPLSAADATPELNLAISFDGIQLFQSGTAYADTGSDSNFAVANGAGAVATAYGSGNYAAADGVGSSAQAGGLTEAAANGSSSNVAFVFGDDSHAIAGGTLGHAGISNYAIIFGNNNDAFAGSTGAASGNYDVAYAEGNNLSDADARGSDYLFSIAKFYGDGPNGPGTAAAADSTNVLSGPDSSAVLADGQAFWSDLFSGDTQGALTAGTNFWTDLLGGADASAVGDSSNLWADLVSVFDGGGTAADLSNFWTDLAGLF